MELNGKILTQLKVSQQQPQAPPNWLFPKRAKQKPLLVVSFFRETLSRARWRTLEVHSDSYQSIHQSAITRSESCEQPELLFNRLQLSEKECSELHMRKFGRFVAREAVLDEEYWTAAWLRAEANWESLSYMRHVESYKRKYAEKEFYALKRRCVGRDGNSLKCFCFVAVKKEDNNIRRTVVNSVVGTLDLSIKHLLRGEKFPGEEKRLSSILTSQETYDARRYAYAANVCVSKFARRQGIASNMLHLATDVASASGVKQLFVHVNADNKPAQELYKRMGFKIVETGSSPVSKDHRLLMSMEL